MTDTSTELKWFCRCLLICLIGLMSYVIFQPSYNFAHWVPHSFLRDLGIPYSALLSFETNADKLLHPLGAALLMVVFVFAELPFLSSKLRVLMMIILAVILAEIIQYLIGRKFDAVDLILGILGASLVYVLLPKK